MKILVGASQAQLGEALSGALLAAGHRVTGMLETRRQLLETLQHDRPQALLLDVALLGPGSREFLSEIMTNTPCAVLLVTSGSDEQLSEVYEAMGSGALDVVTFRATQATTTDDAERLLAKLATIGKLLGGGEISGAPSGREPPLIALGASTGGPAALVQVLSALPRPLYAAVVIVQHVDREFTQGLASWLEGETGLPTELAAPQSAPRAGRVLVAATNDHLVMGSSKTFSYTPHPRELSYRPSVDVLFRSLARHWTRPGMAALLTGMGRDGADGLLALRRARWLTIAQDEASSVVFGMPKAAVELGAAVKVLPLAEIGAALVARR